MPLFKLTYVGQKTWNQVLEKLVCARDAVHAKKAVPAADVSNWVVDPVLDEPEEIPETIMSVWYGDAY